MVGTKIGSFGFFLSLGAMLAAFLLYAILYKQGKSAYLSIALCSLVFALLIPLFLISPGYRLQNRRQEESQTADRPTEDIAEIEGIPSNIISEEDAHILKEYAEEHYWDHFIDPWFLDIYPVEGDPEFWQDVISREGTLNSDSRTFKLEMIHRIRQRNDNPADLLFGIGFTSGIPYAEKDLANQYYLFGGMGLVVLIAPFFLLLLAGGIFLLKMLFKKENFILLCTPCLSIFSFLITAYLAGHVFDTLFTTYFLTFASAYLLSVICHVKA
jgi:hypothetical protein